VTADDEPLVSKQVIREHQVAQDRRWRSAVRAFDPTPDRLRELAAAANGQARVIRLAELGGMNWNPIEGAADWQLAEGLDDESSREGPPELWKAYDKRLRKLGQAMEGDDSRRVAEGFEALRDSIRAIADALDPAGTENEPEAEAGTG
jgi:hypothetical protein